MPARSFGQRGVRVRVAMDKGRIRKAKLLGRSPWRLLHYYFGDVGLLPWLLPEVPPLLVGPEDGGGPPMVSVFMPGAGWD